MDPADYALVRQRTNRRRCRSKEAHTRTAERPHASRALFARRDSRARYNFDGHYVPFLYSTNGEVIWFHDVRHQLSRSRKISQFHTPAALREMLERDFEAACNWLETHPNEHPRLRPYQIRSQQRRLKKRSRDRKRLMLVAMATGTGKTFTLVNEVYRLMKSGVGQRILFLSGSPRTRSAGGPRLCIV